MPKISRLVQGREDRIRYLTKYALIHPEARNIEALTILDMGTFSRSRAQGKDDAATVLARIQIKGDMYGISPESKGQKVVTDIIIPSPQKVRVFGAGMGDIEPEDIKPLTPEEEKAIRETPISAILMAVDRRVPRTNFQVIEEK